MTSANYVGRFAPSPTGSLHFGSLLAAMASYCDARSHNGTWRLRIDDIDPPRQIPDAIDQFPQTLNNYGFQWDGAIILQSMRTPTYLAKLQQLNDDALLYLCRCSRRELDGHKIYPGKCKPSVTQIDYQIQAKKRVAQKMLHSDQAHAIRAILDTSVAFTDLIQGEQYFAVGKQLGDTVVMRRDDLFAYALACAIDDADGISHVVRGADLLPTSAPQIQLIKRLNLTVPLYAHIPIALNAAHQKLSKQTQAEPIDAMPVLPTLLRAWHFLGQTRLNAHSVESFWQAAIPAWRLARVPKCMSNIG